MGLADEMKVHLPPPGGCIATLAWRERALETRIAELEGENRRLREIAAAVSGRRRAG